MVRYQVVAWSDVLDLVRRLAEKIIDSGYRPDVIVGVLRGGIIPAAMLTDMLGVKDILAMRIRLYKGIGQTAERPQILQPIPPVIEGKRVLIVDDVADTGVTLKAAVEHTKFARGGEIKTATLHLKPWSSYVPDYYVEVTDRWIVYPWEYREFLEEVEPLISQGKLSGDDLKAAEEAVKRVRELLEAQGQGTSTSSKRHSGMT